MMHFFDDDRRVGAVSILGLLKHRYSPIQFSIPDYQRGYRWQRKQVEALISDFDTKWPANEDPKGDGVFCDNRLLNKQDRYLLQPIVIKPCRHGYDVVDGQQRLTTLMIMLEEFVKKDGTGFLQGGNIWHIETSSGKLSSACKDNARELFARCTDEQRTKIERHLQSIDLIVYVIDDENDDAHQAFERLNAGKISLTDSELLRALFMPEHAPGASQIAAEWDTIESALHEDSFWFMFNKRQPDCPTRIDRLFKIVADQEENPIKGASFWSIEASIREKKRSPEEWWHDVMTLFWMLRHCYSNVKLYHYVGWIVHMTNARFLSLYRLYDIDRKGFVRNLQRNILGISTKDNSSNISLGIKSVYLKNGDYDFRISDGGFRYLHPYAVMDGYPDVFMRDGAILKDVVTDRKSIRGLLLLINVEILNRRERNVVRFPFKILLDQKWEIEHIASHNNKNAEIVEAESELPESEKFSQEEKNMMWNLALLDKVTNDTYKDKPLEEKRKYIYKLAGRGVKGNPYVPVCTREAFAKAYTDNPTGMVLWTKSDAKDYVRFEIDLISEMWCDAERTED